MGLLPALAVTCVAFCAFTHAPLGRSGRGAEWLLGGRGVDPFFLDCVECCRVCFSVWCWYFVWVCSKEATEVKERRIAIGWYDSL